MAGEDSGAMCGTVLEKDLTLDVAQRAELLLRAAGYATVLTRESDRYAFARGTGGGGEPRRRFAFHQHSFQRRRTRRGFRGRNLLCAPASGRRLGFFFLAAVSAARRHTAVDGESESLAGFIQAALVERTQAVNRGIKSEQFYVIANVRHPAALVEGGFITNKSDVTKLATTEYRQQIALAISDGVAALPGNEPSRAKPTLAMAAARD